MDLAEVRERELQQTESQCQANDENGIASAQRVLLMDTEGTHSKIHGGYHLALNGAPHDLGIFYLWWCRDPDLPGAIRLMRPYLG